MLRSLPSVFVRTLNFSGMKTSTMAGLLLAALLLISTTPNIAGEKPLEVGITEHLDQFLPSGIMLTNESGQLVDIRSLVDKPTVIAFVYYNCPGICTPLMDGIAEVIGRVDMELGKDYQVLTISFNPEDGYALAVKKKINYMNYIRKQWEDAGISDSLNTGGWQFFTGDSANIAVVTEALGFHFKKVGTEFLHTGGLILLSPEGKIVRYINKTFFIPFEFQMAVTEASSGKSGPTINKLLSYCYTYDTAGQGYVLDVTRVSAIIILFIALLIFAILIIRGRRKASVQNQA
jgi:protein SCO1